MPTGQVVAHVAQQVTVGPLPQPEILEKYESIVPGSAKLLFDEFQLQGAHRRRMERFVVLSDVIRAQTGLWFGFGLAAYMIYNGTLLLREGHSVNGFGIIAAAIVTVTGVFVVRNRIQSGERQAQTRAIQPPGKR